MTTMTTDARRARPPQAERTARSSVLTIPEVHHAARCEATRRGITLQDALEPVMFELAAAHFSRSD